MNNKQRTDFILKNIFALHIVMKHDTETGREWDLFSPGWDAQDSPEERATREATKNELLEWVDELTSCDNGPNLNALGEIIDNNDTVELWKIVEMIAFQKRRAAMAGRANKGKPASEKRRAAAKRNVEKRWEGIKAGR